MTPGDDSPFSSEAGQLGLSRIGFWSKSFPENRGLFGGFFSVDFFGGFFSQGKWPEKIHQKIHQKFHRRNQTPKSTKNFREGVSLTPTPLLWTPGTRLETWVNDFLELFFFYTESGSRDCHRKPTGIHTNRRLSWPCSATMTTIGLHYIPADSKLLLTKIDSEIIIFEKLRISYVFP